VKYKFTQLVITWMYCNRQQATSALSKYSNKQQKCCSAYTYQNYHHIFHTQVSQTRA